MLSQTSDLRCGSGFRDHAVACTIDNSSIVYMHTLATEIADA